MFMNENVNIISFAGIEKNDIAYHLFNAISKLQKDISVLIIDNSADKDFFEAIPKLDGESTTMFGNATVVKDKILTREVAEYFDYVFIIHGIHIDIDSLNDSNIVYLQCDYTPKSIQRIASLEFDKEVKIIYVDKTTDKLKEKFIEKDFKLNVADRIVLYQNSQDSESYTLLQHNGKQSISKMSKEYRDMIAELCQDITQENPKKIKKAVK